MSSTAYIYDAIRTPRSKGRPGGRLHEVKPVALASGFGNCGCDWFVCGGGIGWYFLIIVGL
jgi:hypothetical protein